MLESGPEQAKMEPEGGVTSVVKHSLGLGLDSAQRGCGRDCSQTDIHILWEQLAWQGLRTLGNRGEGVPEVSQSPTRDSEEWSPKLDALASGFSQNSNLRISSPTRRASSFTGSLQRG